MSQSGGCLNPGHIANINPNPPSPDLTCSPVRRTLPIAAAFAAAAVLVLSACGGGKSGGSPAPAPPPAPAPLAIVSFAPAIGIAGDIVTVTGTGLNTVTTARVGTVAAVFAIDSSTQLRVTVPAAAASGRIEVSDGASTVQSATSFTVTALMPMTVTGLAPATIAVGQTLTVSGTNLARANTVIFAGGASAPVVSRNGSTSLTAVVPGGAASGTVTVSAGAGDSATSAGALTVVEPIVVTSQVYSVAAGAPVTIAGSGLLQVSGVTVNGGTASISSRTATQLVFVPPAGVACGPIALLSASQPAVAAGAVMIGAGCAVRSAGVEFAQVMSQDTVDGRLRLVPGKETWVRAYVVSELAATAAPVVRVVGFNGATQLGTINLVGPAALPQLAPSSVVPQSMRDNEAQSFNAELPAAWIGTGLRLRVEIDPAQQFGTTIATDVTPVMGTNTYVDLVMVPLVSGANVPTMPNLADVLDELIRKLPVPRDRIAVSLRAPYTLTSVTDGVDTSTEWSAALSELENLRRAEAPAKQYYGMSRPMVTSGTAGIGYVNSVGSSSPSLSSMGWDASRTSWRRTMIHEFGHNYSRRHAPCGGVANPDPNWPPEYPNGVLGPTPLFDSLNNDVIPAAGQTDIMGYCNGSWFSDYNLREAQRFLEARPQPVTITSASSAPSDVLVISGVIDASGVRFAPVRSVRGEAPLPEAGDHMLRLATQAGPVVQVPFAPVEVDHAPGELHFFVSVPDPGPLAGIEVMRGAQRLPMAAAGVVAASRAASTAVAPADAGVAAAVRGNDLEVTWNPAAARFVTVTAVSGATRHVLAIDARGGRVAVPQVSLPPGGSIEVSLSDGLNARTLVLARP